MQPRIPEKNKKPGVCYAVTDDGIELPVIDITHPAFALEMDQSELEVKTKEYLRGAERRARIPAFVMRLLLWLWKRRSILVRSFLQAKGSFVSGMVLYLIKLGPDNLGTGYAGRIDRKFAQALPAVSARLRLQDMARLLAEGLAPVLAARPASPLHLVNIGGGPAMDSLNALILLRRQQRPLLEGRRIFIHCLDLDEVGPRFGVRALGALQGADGPLQGLEIAFEHIRYNWSEAAGTRAILDGIGAEGIVGGSSEGGLFDYGSDEEVLANLAALRQGTPEGFVIAGTLTRADAMLKGGISAVHLAIKPRKLEEFRELVRKAGWEVVRVISRPFSQDVLLAKGDHEGVK